MNSSLTADVRLQLVEARLHLHPQLLDAALHPASSPPPFLLSDNQMARLQFELRLLQENAERTRGLLDD